MIALLNLVLTVLNIIVWLMIAAAVFSWLVAFNVVNTRNRAVYMIGDFLNRATEPLLRPIRRFMPNLGGLDLSPMVLILLIIFVRDLITEYAVRAVYGGF